MSKPLKAVITIKPRRNVTYLEYFDNPLATATLVNLSLRENIGASELTKHGFSDSILFTSMKGDLSEVKMYYDLYCTTKIEGSTLGTYFSTLSAFKYYVNNYARQYNVGMRLIENVGSFYS